jgi:aminoglycoside 6'-N-acetyltransferase I
VKIVDLLPDDDRMVQQVVALLVEAFALGPGYLRTTDAALAVVMGSFAPKHLSRVALDAEGNAQGWVGGNEQYDGLVYELDPLAVKPGLQRHGIGRALVLDFEEQARKRGALTVILGTDDDTGGTSLFGADVYPDVCTHISSIRNLANHPYEFYEKCGYAIVGLVPDANGFGKPDILMAKRVGLEEGRREGARR